MTCSWGRLGAAFTVVTIILVPHVSLGQVSLTSAEKITRSIEQNSVPLLLKDAGGTVPAQVAEEDGGGKFRTRQALILSGVALSMLAYGYFVLQYNNSRTNSEQARLAYESDVRENAQEYVDQGVSLDEIPSYFAWERAYTDAANDRELTAIAGLSAFLLSFAAILDSATSGNDNTLESQVGSMTPVLGVSPWTGDVRLGARIGL